VARQMPPDLGVVQTSDVSAAEPAPITLPGSRRLKTTRRLRSCFALKPYPGQPLARYRDAAVAPLRKSIMELGLLVPPLVWRNGTTWIVLAGYRRVRAWQLLALDGLVPDHITVNVCEGITERDARRLVIAEESHREEEFPVARAERIGTEWLAMSEDLGREATLEEMAAILKPQKTTISDALVIYRALQDPRLEGLVRKTDEAGKTLLVKALRLPDFPRRRAALEAFQNGGRGAMSKIVSPRTGRPLKPVTRHSQGSGYDLTVRYRPSMSQEEGALARCALLTALEDIDALLAAGGVE
jgi:ParB-like chromosome segregation protein Spo0J